MDSKRKTITMVTYVNGVRTLHEVDPETLRDPDAKQPGDTDDVRGRAVAWMTNYPFGNGFTVK